MRVRNEGLWYAVVAEVATAVRTVPGVTMVLRLDQVSELDLDVPPWVPPGQRSLLLSVALRAAGQGPDSVLRAGVSVLLGRCRKVVQTTQPRGSNETERIS